MIKNQPFHILITSLSKKVPLIREVRKAVNEISEQGKLFGADCNADCIGHHFVDDFWQMPSIDKIDLNHLIRYCQNRDIRAIIPTRDSELAFFADHRDSLKMHGIDVLVAGRKAVRICLDKKEFHDSLVDIEGLHPVETFDQPDPDYGERWVIKERFGAGSTNIAVDLSVKNAQSSLVRFDAPICQPFIAGKEYSVDLYHSRNHVPKGCIVRTRDLIINGESQVTTTVNRQDIENICLAAAAAIGLSGHSLFQLIEDSQGDFHIIECNCRFGGASTLSIAAGLDTFCWFFRECMGDDLADIPFVTSTRQIRQIRYAADKIVLNDSFITKNTARTEDTLLL